MSETLKHNLELSKRLEAEFGNSAVTPDSGRSTRRIVLPILGGSGPDEYDFSPGEYLLRRWRREVMQKRLAPAHEKRVREMQKRYL